MRILIGCECSGALRRAFRERGFDAWSCDLKASEDGSPHHLQRDLREVICDWPDRWALMIAHPDCTYLSVSGLHWNKRGRMVDGRPRAELTEEALAFVRFLMGCPIRRKVIENPISCISSRIRKPDQIIQPYMFGDDASKATCLWLENMPKLKPTRFVEPRVVSGRRRWANQTDSGQNRLAPSATRAADRARTYPGIAAAAAEQWGDYLRGAVND